MPELDDFEALADDVRASAPRPRDAYLSRLEDRVEAGFPRQSPRRRRERGWLWAPGLALAACALLALVVAVGALSGSEDEPAAGGSAASPVMEQREGGAAPEQPDLRAAPEAAQGDRSAAVPPGAPPRLRRVERRSTLELAPDGEAFPEVTAGVLRVADGAEAIVQRSTVTERDGRGYATYDLRVPASRLDDVLAELSDLATVTSRTASTRDITAPFVSARSRLVDARDERRALLRALGRADSERERDVLRARIRLARGRISRAEASVRRLSARSDRARLDVTVASTGRTGDGGAWTPGDALDDAGRVLEVAAGVAVVAGAVLLPLAILAALAAAAARVTRRRRREAALG